MENRYKGIIALVAQNHGEDYEQVREEMDTAISAAARNPDELARRRFQMIFGETIPTAEEFLERIVTILRPMV